MNRVHQWKDLSAKTTMYLPSKMLKDLKRLARKTGQPIAEIVRRSLKHTLENKRHWDAT